MWALRRRTILWWRSVRARARCNFREPFKRGRDERNTKESAVRVTAALVGGWQCESAIELRFAVAEQSGRAANSHCEWHSLRRAARRESDTAGLHALSGCGSQEAGRASKGLEAQRKQPGPGSRACGAAELRADP